MRTCKYAAAMIFVSAMLFSTIGTSEDVSLSSENAGTESRRFDEEIKPVLERHCFACHGPYEQKGDLRLDTLDPTFGGPAAETWHDVLNRVSIGEMPPEDETPLHTEARRKLVGWLRANLDRVARERKGTGNQTTLRRLTNYEYNNTLRDLLGLNLDFARDLPPESNSPDGFKNNGSSLGISPMQIEYYLKVARSALEKAVVDGPAPEVYSHKFEESSKGNARRNGPVTGNRMPPQGRFLGTMLEFPRDGEFVVRVKAGAAVPDGSGVPRMQIKIGLRADTLSPAKVLGEVDVANSEDDKVIYEFRGRIEEFPLPGHNPKFPGVTVTVTNVYDDGLKAVKKEKVKAIKLTASQTKQVRTAVKQNKPSLALFESQVENKKTITGLTKTVSTLQRQIEELRLLSPQHKNQTDLAYRLYDISQGIKQEARIIKDLAQKQLKDVPTEVLQRYKAENKEALADRNQVLERFQSIVPINRKSGQRSGSDTSGPPRTTLVVDYLEFEGPIYKTWPPETHTRLLPASNFPERQQAQNAIESLMSRAYRRPVSDEDVKPVLKYYEQIRTNSGSFEEAMREAFAMVLIAPEFLYLVEPTGETPRPLTQFELASRLSYFLWSTMPDDHLFSLARTEGLNDPDKLEQQVRAMIADPRSDSFVEHFTDQWLDLSGIDRVAINPEYYPDFDDRLKPMMRGETHAFFNEVLRQDLSALNFIDSDFAMLNESLAKHYGVTDSNRLPRGGEFERVTLHPEEGRGGLLTQGSFLLTNSTGEDSHPIRRAVWVLDRILGTPPAPPPPDVPELDSEQADFAKLPLKQQLEMHRTKAACNDCHRGIDPWGVAFESFNAVGQHRDSVLRKVGKKSVLGAVDSVATLPNGTKVHGADGLKAYLLEHDTERFSRALVSKLLTYALGRSLVLQDRPTVESLVKTFQANDYRLSDLIVAIAQSETFQSK